jgi:hypothetical protein
VRPGIAPGRRARDNHQVITEAAQAASTSSAAIGPAVLVVLVIIGVWRYSLPGKDGKGTIPGRFLAIVLFLFACWVLLAVTHTTAAMQLADGTVSGIATLFSAAAKII